MPARACRRQGHEMRLYIFLRMSGLSPGRLFNFQVLYLKNGLPRFVG
jgi:hypothetical protein